MSKQIKVLFFMSLIINLIIFSLGSIIVYKKGVAYVFAKTQSSIMSNDNSQDTYYLAKSSIYKSLGVQKDSIIFLGDSITEMGQWSELFNNPKIINRGISGDTTSGIIERIKNIYQDNPSKIFIMAGTNDIEHEIDTKETISNYKKILQTIKSESPKTKIYVQSILPINEHIKPSKTTNAKINDLNKSISEISDEMGVIFIDLSDSFKRNNELDKKFTYDGLHLLGEGYEVWKKQVQTYVNE